MLEITTAQLHMVSCDVLLCIYSRDQMIYKKLPSCCRIIPLGYNTVRGGRTVYVLYVCGLAWISERRQCITLHLNFLSVFLHSGENIHTVAIRLFTPSPLTPHSLAPQKTCCMHGRKSAFFVVKCSA